LNDAVPLLQVEGLRIEAPGVVAVADLSFETKRGECLAIVGESGSGKTMVARSILGLLPPAMRVTAGHIDFEGRDLARVRPAEMRALRGTAIGMVFQEPMVSLNPALTIGTQLAEGLRYHRKLSEAEIERRCVDMLQRVRIADPHRCLKAHPHEFSGGMRQRIVLASTMLLHPKLLIADEPTTALDNLSQREVLDLIAELRREFGVTVLLITHNLGLVYRYADRAVVLERGRLVESGAAREVLSAPTQPYTRRLVASLPRRRTATVPRPEKEPLIAVRSLTVEYPPPVGLPGKQAAVCALRSVDLDVARGEMVAVVGGSGCGKTTLGRAILGLVPRASGSVGFCGQDALGGSSTQRRAFRLASQLVYQDPYSSLDPRMRIADIVAEPLRARGTLSRAERYREVSAVLEEVALAGFERRYPHELSGGQRQRVAIARAIVVRPAFVVADEPVSALDMTIQTQVLKLFGQLQAAHGFACLFISHDFAAVGQIADRVVVMQDGRIVEQGTCDEVLDSPRHPYTRALIEATPVVPLETAPVNLRALI
jgi:peptide/nickel transport system ATP-binding protein